MVQKTPCVRDDWSGDKLRYSAMCYSDVPYLYSGRGFAAGYLPYADNGGRYQAMEYPVVIGYFAYGTAWITRTLAGSPDLTERRAVAGDQVYGQPGVNAESSLYFIVTAVLLAPFALLAAWFLTGVHRRRPWDAMLVAASPALVLTGLINWDLLAVTAVAGALWAWSRGRPVLSGVLIGLGTATKLYPLFLLGALLVVCLRRGRLPGLRGGRRRRGCWRVAGGEPAGDADRLRPVEGVLDLQRRAGRRPRLALAGVAAGRAHRHPGAHQPRLAGVLRGGLRRRSSCWGCARAVRPGSRSSRCSSSSASCWSTRCTRRSTSSGCCRSSRSPGRAGATC